MSTRPLRIYIDTSVIGGCFDDEFALWSNGLMKDIRLGHMHAVVSELVGIEIAPAPQKVRNKYEELLDDGAEVLMVDDRVLDLMLAYKRHKILPEKFENDMTHIALATVNQVNILVSWNFKHIVHFDKIRQFNVVNEKKGYKAIAIHSPREVTNYGEEV